jgi:DNA-binding MarR family transcriptional regulator
MFRPRKESIVKKSVQAANLRKSEKQTAETAQTPPEPAGWTFLTNHMHVLLCLYRDPEATLRQVASRVGITERMVQKIVAELVAAGFAEVTRIGRRNSYSIRLDLRLRHPLEAHHSIGELLRLLSRP